MQSIVVENVLLCVCLFVCPIAYLTRMPLFIGDRGQTDRVV